MKNNVGFIAGTLLLTGLLCWGVTELSDHLSHVQELKRNNSTLTKNVSDLKGALDLSEKYRKAEQSEIERLKALEALHQQEQAQLAQRLNKEKEESRNEIRRLETALRAAGVTDAAVPADVVRMQRERAKAINRKASGGDVQRQQHASGDGR